MHHDRSITAWVASAILPHERDVRVWLRRAGSSPADSDDIIQQAYCTIAALDSIDHIRNGRAYFFATARSLLLQRVRRDRVVPIRALTEQDDPRDEAPSPERETDGRRQLHRVLAVIAELPASYRRTIELRRIEGLSQRETAERLGTTEKIVENNLARGVKAVLKAIATPDEPATEEPQFADRRSAARN